MNKQLIVSDSGGVPLIDLDSNAGSQNFLHSFYQNIRLLIKMTFFLSQNIVCISGRQVVWSYQLVKRQNKEVQMVRLHISAFMTPEVSPLSLITSYMFVIKVLVRIR